MLKRIDDDTFRERTGETVQIIAVAANNSGVKGARFRYGTKVLTADTINGHPGCTFTVTSGAKRFEAIVGFPNPAPAGARYDLFEVDPQGIADLEEAALGDDDDSVIAFTVEGVAAAVFASASKPRRAKRKAAKKKKKKKRKAAKKKGR